MMMETSAILEEIKKLPVNDRLEIIQKTAKMIETEDDRYKMSIAAEHLYNDYKTNPELTSFTNLDFEDFYEPR